MAERDTIIKRVHKLLALGKGNASAGEATSAVLMAQRLIVKYGIADSELDGGEGTHRAISSAETEPLVNARTWRTMLANLIARSFRCKVWEQENTTWTASYRRCNRPSLVFYGYEQDAQAARLSFEYLYRAGNRLANAQVRGLRMSGSATNGAYNSYITGFLSGLRSELEKQSRELMVVLPLEVAEKYEDEVASGLTSGKVRELSCDYRRHGLIEQGIRDGRDAVRSRRIEDTHDFALEG